MGGLLCLYRCSFWRFFWQRLGPARSRQHPTVHRKVGLGCTNRQLVRGLFSYKNPTHQPGKLNTVQLRVTQRRANFSAGYKRDLALDDKSVSSTAVLDQRLCLWKPQPFEKVWRKLYFIKTWLRGFADAQPSTGRLGWNVQNGSLPGTFSLTKSSPIGKRKFSCRFSLQKALPTTKYFARCGVRPKALPLETTAF